jgi:CubicO group peptidase (beta-lactamase class C family)
MCLLVIAILASGLVQAQSTADHPKVAPALKLIEIWIDAEIAYKEIPGMSVGIVYDQELIWSKGFGYANIEKKIPASPSKIYSICSISKLFTSISVMQLRDQGKLNLDDPVGKYLSWFTIKDTYPDAQEITLRGILTHSSGLPRESDYPYWTGPEHYFPTREEIIEKLSKQEELYPADTYFQYSNLGLTLAGEAVAAVSGQPYAEYVKHHILDPLGLQSTSPEIPAEHEGGRLAAPYSSRLRDGNRKAIPFYLVNGVAPAAGFASTVEDLGRFASWQFRLLEKGGTEVLAANTLKEMHRVHWLDPNWKTTWGLGFSVWRHKEKTFIGHSGGCPGYRTQLAMCPQEKIAIVAMTNANDVSPGFYANRIFDIIAPAIKEAIEKPEQEKKAYPDLEKYVGRYERPLGREMYVLIMDGELTAISLLTDNPLDSLTKLKHIEENTFRRVRDDGNLGEKIVFELGPDDKVTRLIWHSNYLYRVN